MDNSFDINLSTGIKITTMSSYNASESGACSASNNDTTNADKTVKCKISEDYVSYFLGTGASESPEIGNIVSALVFNIFNDSETSHTCECPTRNLTIHDEPCKKDFSEYLATSVSSEKIMIDIFRIISELIKISFTHEDLNGTHLMQTNKKLKYLQDKGLYIDEIASEIQKVINENGTEKLAIKDFYQIIGCLTNFSCLEKYVKAVNADAHRLKNLKRMKFLTETGQLSDELLFSLERIDKGLYDIQRDSSKMKQFDIPGIVEFMKTLERLGLLSKLLLFKLTNIGKESIVLSQSIHSQICLVDDTIQIAERLLSKSIYFDGEKLSKKTDKQSKGSICRYEHNIPLCGKCGWRNSWVKAFKKRGVYIKEAEGTNEKHIWINNIIEC